MAVLELRPGILDRIKRLHGITSDKALAQAIGVSERTITRAKSDPRSAHTTLIAGLCTTFDYSPNDIVRAVLDTASTHAA